MPAFAATKTAFIRVDTYLGRPDRPPRPPKPTKTGVDICNIPSGDTVYSTVLIIAEVTGEFDSVVYRIDSGDEYPMSGVGSTNRFQASWDTTQFFATEHTVTVEAKSDAGNVLASDSVGVTVFEDYQWELYYEIDYMADHEPPQSVLDYIQSYWKGHAIKVSFSVAGDVLDPTPDGYISSDDFWNIEASYNGGNDQAQDGVDADGDGYDEEFFLNEKWMLYGTWDENPNVGGYAYVLVDRKDGLAGNYIFIADAMIDNWEAQDPIPDEGGEVIVVGHECGHSIGILVLRGQSEKYDPDAYSIMSYMRLENAKYMASHWYYSKEYWDTANLNYYI